MSAVTLHYRNGALRDVPVPNATFAETICKHVNAGGYLFELEDVTYPCREWVTLAEVTAPLVIDEGK